MVNKKAKKPSKKKPVRHEVEGLIEQEYEALPYPKYTFYQTHPWHLFSLATLFGLTPTPVENAKVLEIGCASGSNIIPIAFQQPSAHFLGIDISSSEIKEGLKEIKDMKLKNITLRHQSILDFGEGEDKFDYIICHGVYSWVSDEIKDKILQICQNHLTKNGIAYISYNTYPGWHLIECVKDLIQWHTKDIDEPKMKVKQARNFLSFFNTGLHGEKTSYADIIRAEVNSLGLHDDSYIYHEHFASFNHPIFFQDFVTDLKKHNLQFLTEAMMAKMNIDILPSGFHNELNKIEDIGKLGQYIDFICNQRFRCSLICHQDQKINRNIGQNVLEKFYYTLTSVCDKPDFNDKDIGQTPQVTYSTALSRIRLSNPIAQQIMLILQQEKYKPIHFRELCDKISAKTDVKNIEHIKFHLEYTLPMIPIIKAGLVKVTCYPGDYSLHISDKPCACPLARYQALTRIRIVNRLHENIILNTVSQCLLPHMDGTKDITALAKIARHNLDFATLNILDENNKPLQNEVEIKSRIETLCKNTLEQLAKDALLIAPTKLH